MTAIEILRETLFAILTNWRQAIRVFLPPLVILVCVVAGAVVLPPTQSVMVDGQTVQVPSPFLFTLFPLLIFLIFWPVVAWHRVFILDDQPTGFAPPIRFWAVLRYVLNLLGLGILICLPLFPILALVAPMMMSGIEPEAIARGEMPPLKFMILPSLASLPVLYLGLRLCLILPGAAVENHIGLSGSWNYTSNRGATLPLLVLLAITLSIIFQVILTTIAPNLLQASEGVLAVVQLIHFIGQLLGSLFVISVMSTMFLAYVPGKEAE